MYHAACKISIDTTFVELTANVRLPVNNIIKIKIHSSCEIEDFVETHLCKLCVILRYIAEACSAAAAAAAAASTENAGRGNQRCVASATELN